MMSGFLSSLDKAAEFIVLWVDHSFYNGIYTPTPVQKGKCEGYSLNKAFRDWLVTLYFDSHFGRFTNYK